MSLVRPNIIIGTTLVIVVLIMLSLTQELSRRWQVQREVQDLENQVNELRHSIVELENLNTYFQSDDYQERLAREKLNYRAEGEQVVLIPENPPAEQSGQNRLQQVDERPNLPQTNPLRWWEVFFVDSV